MFGIFRCTKRTSTSRKRLYLSENLRFGAHPIQSLVRKWKLCKPSLTAHIKHRWRMPHSPHLELHQAVPLPPSPIQRHCRPGVRQHHHTDFNQEGKRVQYYRTSHVKECLGSEGEPTALPRKRSRHRGQYSGSILTQRLLSFYNMSFLVQKLLVISFPTLTQSM